MCGRYVMADVVELSERFQLRRLPPALFPDYNVAPGQPMPVVVADGEARSAQLMRWGLIPSWAKDPKIGSHTINARAEGLADKPSFRTPFRRQRCIVPASGFYEWRKTGSTKTPYFIHRQDGELVGFAGLWDRWRTPEGQEVQSYTIITTEPNALVAPIHNHMPAILEPEHEDDWLNPDNHDTDFLATLLTPYPAEALAAYPVSRDVNDVANTGEQFIAPRNSA